jgi:Cyclopropane fatty acid synthase and related methyltransferases
MQSPYTEDYYLRGPEKGLSNYVDYRWQEEPTMALARRIAEVLGIEPGETVLDWGCARGYLVKAFRKIGVNSYGYDISEWAIQNCDPEVRNVVSTNVGADEGGEWDHIVSKDTLEHLESIDLMRTADLILKFAQVSILIMVPLTERVGGQYVRREDDMDTTHKIRWPLEDWMEFFRRRILGEEWVLQGSWHIPSLKPTSLTHPKSCGFILLTRA